MIKILFKKMTAEGRRSEVILLDDRRVELIIQSKLFAGDLFDIVSSHFNLKEKEYFGLAFLDETGQYSWLNLDKRVLEHEYAKKQTNDKLILYFLVKYFVESITQLNDTASVELFYLQAKSLVANEVIQVDSDAVFELSALVLQATYGDHTNESTVRAYLKKLQLIPTYTLKEHLSVKVCDEKVNEHYKKLKGQSRGDAIVKYMSIIEKQPTYGVHFYETKDKSGIPWWLGLSYKGISQFDYNDRKVPRRGFLWKQLENLYFRDKKFSIEVRDPKRVVHTLSSINLYENAIEEASETFDDLSNAISDPTTQVSVSRRTFGPGNVTVYVWFAANSALTKCIWSMAIAQHQFYIDKRNLNKHIVHTQRTLQEISAELSLNSNVLSSSRSNNFPLRRSISSHSLPTLRIEEESLNRIENLKEEKQKEMFETLKVRKEALEEALNKKLTELKALCLKEAELTGELPPETPLVPGEPVPQIRRRIGTSFTLNDKLLVKPKSKEEEILSKLELEYDIQTKIVSAAQKLVNESAVKKNVRRQRKQAFQQALVKMKDLEGRLITLRKQIAAANFTRNRRQPSVEDVSEDNVSHSTDESQEKFETMDEKLNGNSFKKKLINLPIESSASILSRSLPPSPVRFKGTHTQQRSLSPNVTSFVPIQSIKVRSFHHHRPRSASVKFERSSDNHHDNDNLVNDGASNTETASEVSSIGSSSCGTTNSVIHIHGKERSSLKLQSPYVNKYESSVKVEGSNLYSVPNRRISIALQSQDDAAIRANAKRDNASSPYFTLHNSKTFDNNLLARSNSLENTRRKSQLTKHDSIIDEQSNETHHQHYHNHHPSFRMSRNYPRTPPPLPPSNINIAQRPLPSPPAVESESRELQSSVNYAKIVYDKSISEYKAQIYESIRDECDTGKVSPQLSVYTTNFDHIHTESLSPKSDKSMSSKLSNAPLTINESHNNECVSPSVTSPSFVLSPPPKVKTWTESSLDVVLSSKATYSIIQKTPNKQHHHHHHHHNHLPPLMRPQTAYNAQLSTASNASESTNSSEENSQSRDSVSSPTPVSVVKNVLPAISLSHSRYVTKTAIPVTVPLSSPLPPLSSPGVTGVDVNVVSVGHIQPYWEEEKPYELSDFYKYSTKHRKQNAVAQQNNNDDTRNSQNHSSQPSFHNASLMPQQHSPNNHEHSDPNVSLNDSFNTKPNVVGSFHDELLSWYDEKDHVKNATLV